MNRSSQILDAITAWNAWLTPEIRQQKYAKMAYSPFGFYRGTNHLFWRDFAGDVRLAQFGGAVTWLQGDLHVENFGAFTNDRGKIVYSINDFDEAVYADYQYDVWRMAISLGLALEGQAASAGWLKWVAIFAETYLERLAQIAENNALKKEAFNKKNTKGVLRKFLEGVEKENSRAKLLAKWTIPGKGRFNLTNEQLASVPSIRQDEICAAMAGYMDSLTGTGKAKFDGQLKIKDIAGRLNAGTGSLGTPRYYLLIEGRKKTGDDDVILDVKRQGPPSAMGYLQAEAQAYHAEKFSHEAQRAVSAYRAMTHNTDDYLGWMELEDGSFLVRERTWVKQAFPLEKLKGGETVGLMAEQWGQILATLHARAARWHWKEKSVRFEEYVSDVRQKQEQAFKEMVCEVAVTYVAQVKEDWKAFIKQVNGKSE